MKKIRYAIIGFGGIAENRIGKEGFALDKKRFKALSNAVLVGATDRNPAREAAAKAYGLKWYKSSEEILNDKTIDAVFIATNNLSHASEAKKVMQAGKHCIIDKPAATTVEDTKELIKLAKSKKVSLAVDHMMICNAYNIKAKQLIAKGALGKVNDVCLHMEFCYGSTPEEAKTWRCAVPEELGGPIGDVGSHCMYVAEFLFDSEITSLSCVYYPKTLKINVEDGAYIKFQMKNGLTGSVKVAFNEPRGGLYGTLSNLGYEIYGDKAVMRTYGTLFQLSGHDDEPIPVKVEIHDGKKVKDVKADKIQNIYQTVIAHHADSIIKGKLMDGSDALKSIKLIMAAHESAQKNGKTIKVS